MKIPLKNILNNPVETELRSRRFLSRGQTCPDVLGPLINDGVLPCKVSTDHAALGVHHRCPESQFLVPIRY